MRKCNAKLTWQQIFYYCCTCKDWYSYFIREVFLRLNFMEFWFAIKWNFCCKSALFRKQHLKCYRENPQKAKTCLNFVDYVYVFSSRNKSSCLHFCVWNCWRFHRGNFKDSYLSYAKDWVSTFSQRVFSLEAIFVPHVYERLTLFYPKC